MNDEDRLLDLVAQWDLQRQRGREMTAEELCKDSPELLDELRLYIQRIRATQWMTEDWPGFDDPEAEKLHSGLSIDEFCACVVRSGLMTQSDLQVFRDQHPVDDAAALATELVDQQRLTSYQATRLCDGDCSGHVLDDYIIQREIGSGGMGQVFLAEHRPMERQVAIKLLPRNDKETPQTVARFRREVRAAAKLDHPNIVTAYDAGESAGTHFLVMQYAEGCDLMMHVRRHGPLPIPVAVDYVCQAAEALVYAHSLGVVHRDIKPGNLMLTQTGVPASQSQYGMIRVLDMGLARLEELCENGDLAETHTDLTQDGMVMGTVDFMSPEQAVNAKEVDGRTDVYSLACTLYYLVTGNPPFTGSTTMARIVAHREAPIPDLPKSPETNQRIVEVFRRGMAKELAQRYPSMEAFLQDLRELEFPDYEPLPNDLGGMLREPGVTDSGEAGQAESVDTESRAVAETVSFVEGSDRSGTPESHASDREQAATLPVPQGRKVMMAVIPLILLALLGWGLAEILIKFQVSAGTLVIQSNVADFEVEFDTQSEFLTVVDPIDNTKVTVEIPSGAKTLRVRKGGFIADVPKFSLESVRGVIHVKFVKSDSAPIKPEHAQRMKDPDFATAWWVLDRGGKVTIDVQSEAVPLTEISELPGGPFTVTEVSLYPVPSTDLVHHLIAPNIKVLDLGNANPSVKDFEHVATMQSLQTLMILDVSDDHLIPLSSLSNLQTLGCRGSEITIKGFAALATLPLRKLNIKANISDAELKELAKIKTLTSLNLTSFGSQIESFKDLSQLPLEELHVRRIAFGEAAMESLAKFRITSLSIQECQGIAIDDLLKLQDLTTLKKLQTEYSHFPVQQLSALEGAGISIHSDASAGLTWMLLQQGAQVSAQLDGSQEQFTMQATSQWPSEYFQVIAIDLSSIPASNTISVPKTIPGTFSQSIPIMIRPDQHDIYEQIKRLNPERITLKRTSTE